MALAAARPRERLLHRGYGQHAEGAGDAGVEADPGDARGGLLADVVIVVGLAADDGAEAGDPPVAAGAGAVLRGERQLEGAGDLVHLDGSAGLCENPCRAVDEPLGEVRVETPDRDGEGGALHGGECKASAQPPFMAGSDSSLVISGRYPKTMPQSLRRSISRFAVLAAALSAAVPVSSALAGPAPHGTYINPFRAAGWQPSRTDMGVDWAPTAPLPVLAIGDAVILGSEGHASWPGHHLIWYRLLDGSHAGDVVYVAEHLKRLAPAGETVRAGQQIAVALPGYPWTEWGWADEYGSPRAYPCYREGKQTSSGKEMARFLMSLGATPGDPAGRGPDGPVGKRC